MKRRGRLWVRLSLRGTRRLRLPVSWRSNSLVEELRFDSARRLLLWFGYSVALWPSISSVYLVPFAHPHHSSLISVIDPDHDNVNINDNDDQTPSQPRLVFVLSHRLLAFASSPPCPDSPTSSTMQPPTHSRPLSGTFGISQTELGNALKVGGTMLRHTRLPNPTFVMGTPAREQGLRPHPPRPRVQAT